MIGLVLRKNKEKGETMKSPIILDMQFWSIPDAQAPRQLSILSMKPFILPSTPNRGQAKHWACSHKWTSDSHQQTASFCTPREEERHPQAEPTVESYMCRSLDRKKNDTWTENRWCSIGSWAWGSIALFSCVCLNHLGTPKTGTGVDFCCTIILDKS